MELQDDLFGKVLEALEGEGEMAEHFVENDELFSDARMDFARAEAFPTISEEDYLSIADGLLESTIREAFGVSRGGKPYAASKNAFEWLLVDDPFDDECYPFSYRNCCKAAGVDPDELREQLVALKRRYT